MWLVHQCQYSPFLVFFQSFGDHRSLHSFPTRRSSDLVTASGGVSSIDDLLKLKAVGETGVDSVIVGRALYERRFTRSEEHTSELQSRVDLVCRLLLEKKKHSN